MADNLELSVQLALETQDFKSGIKNIDRELKNSETLTSETGRLVASIRVVNYIVRKK